MNDVQPEGEPIAHDKPFTIEVAERVRRLPPYLFAQINKVMYEKRRTGEDVIDLGMGNPSDPPQDLVIEKLAEAARDPKNHGYAPAQGILSLRREAAAKAMGLDLFDAFATCELPALDESRSGFRLVLPLGGAGTGARTGVPPGHAAVWWIRDFIPAPGYAGALCVEQENAEPSFYHLRCR